MERSNSDSVDPGAGSRIFDEYGFVVPLRERESDEEGGEHRSHMYRYNTSTVFNTVA